MITDISVAVNSPVDDDTGCKLHFTRLVCQTSMIRKSRQFFFFIIKCATKHTLDDLITFAEKVLLVEVAAPCEP